MSEEQQVGLVVSVNYDKLKEFYDAWQREQDKAKKNTKSGFQEMSEEAGKFVRNALGGAVLSAGTDLARAITAPIRTSFSAATESAEKFRADNTRIAIAAGQDWKELGDRLKQVSQATGRNQDEIKAYASGVEAVTKRWDTAFDSVEAYNKLAHKTGRDLGSFGGLSGTMENLFGLKDNKEVESFFDRLISKAKALGLNANQAVSQFERLAPSLGRNGVSADKAGEFSNAMLKAGASPEQAQEMGGFWSNYFKSGTRWIEREMRSAGVLKKGQNLTDQWGRLNYGTDDLIDMYYRTQKHIRKGMSDSDFREISIDNLGNEAGSMFSNWPKIKAQIAVQRGAEEKRVLDGAFQTFLRTDKGRADQADRGAENANLDMGGQILGWRDLARGHGGWGGAAMTYGGLGVGSSVALGATKVGLGYLGLTSGAATAGALSSALFPAAALLGGAGYIGYTSRDPKVREGYVSALGAMPPKSLMPDQAPMSPDDQKIEFVRREMDRRQGIRSGPLPWLFGAGEAKDDQDLASMVSPEQAAKLQADATEKAMKAGQPLRVQIVGFGFSAAATTEAPKQ